MSENFTEFQRGYMQGQRDALEASHVHCIPRQDYDALMAMCQRALAANSALAKELRELKDKSE